MSAKKDSKTPAQQLHDEQPRKPVGRPRQYATAAERQRAYRARLRESGMRVITRVVRDVRDDAQPLRSELIDLSEVRTWPGRQ